MEGPLSTWPTQSSSLANIFNYSKELVNIQIFENMKSYTHSKLSGLFKYDIKCEFLLVELMKYIDSAQFGNRNRKSKIYYLIKMIYRYLLTQDNFFCETLAVVANLIQ